MSSQKSASKITYEGRGSEPIQERSPEFHLAVVPPRAPGSRGPGSPGSPRFKYGGPRRASRMPYPTHVRKPARVDQGHPGEHIYPKGLQGAYIPIHSAFLGSFVYSLNYSRGYRGHIDALVDEHTLTRELDRIRMEMDKRGYVKWLVIPAAIVDGVAVLIWLLITLILFIVALVSTGVDMAATVLSASLGVGFVIVALIISLSVIVVLIIVVVMNGFQMVITLKAKLKAINKSHPSVIFDVMEHEAHPPARNITPGSPGSPGGQGPAMAVVPPKRTYYGIVVKVARGAESAIKAKRDPALATNKSVAALKPGGGGGGNLARTSSGHGPFPGGQTPPGSPMSPGSPSLTLKREGSQRTVTPAPPTSAVPARWVSGGPGVYFCSECGYKAPDNTMPLCVQCQAPCNTAAYCAKCGVDRAGNVKFCPSCGDKYPRVDG